MQRRKFRRVIFLCKKLLINGLEDIVHMKKTLILILLLCVIAFTLIYTLIPSKLRVSNVIYIEATENIAQKYISDKNGINSWWPAINNKPKTKNQLLHTNYFYRTLSATYNSVTIEYQRKEFKESGLLSFSAIGSDSLQVVWQTSIITGNWPVSRIARYIAAVHIKRDMNTALQNLKVFLENEEAIYGINIKKSSVKDSILATQVFTSVNYPETSKIYRTINHIKSFIKEQGIAETGYPMLNVAKINNRYTSTVALPVKKLFRVSDSIKLNRMVLGNILVTQTRGGRNTIANAFTQLNNYIHDNKMISPAMPFEVLVTNRVSEPDTSKWITQIHYPVF